jgi:outer membrane biosynthesis protein TonB
MAQGRNVGEHTLVMPYASVETVETRGPAPGAVGPCPLLLEAKLVWGRDTLAVRHVSARGAVRVRDLSLAVPGCDDLVVGSVDPATGTFALRLPNGNLVPEGCRMTVRIGRALLRLTLVPDDIAKLPRTRHDSLVAFGLLAAAALHLVMLGTVAHSRSDEGETEQAARATMLRMVASAEERALSELAAVQQTTRETRAEELAAAAAVASTPEKEEAKAGNPSKRDGAAARTRITRGDERHAAIVTPTTSPSKKHDTERDESATFGILALLAGEESSTRPGSSAFAPETGRSAMGNIFGQTIDDAAGIGGLGLSGAGEGGGGKGAGIPLGSIGTLGCCGGRAPILREHQPGYHWVSDGGGHLQVYGRLGPEPVQRVVRQSFGRLRACYEAGLQRDPGLEGRVSVKFVIDREGAVTMAMPWADTTLPDQAVARCVAKAYEAMEFPKPTGGIVTVVYPVVFTRTSP